jgi:hypothetical protein
MRNASGMLHGRAATGGLVLILNLIITLGLTETAFAQSEATEIRSADVRAGTEEYRTFYLTSMTEPNEANEIVSDLRNMLPKARAYYVSADGAISMRATVDDLALAQRVLADMDRKREVYRITYSIKESEDGKAVGTRRVALIVSTGGKTSVKQGNRMPIVTGSPDGSGSGKTTQVQYIDLGLNIEASLEGSADGLRLHSRVEQSSLSGEKSGIGAGDPVIEQTRLDGFTNLAEGRSMVLGSLDFPGTARHEEIEVVSELVH